MLDRFSEFLDRFIFSMSLKEKAFLALKLHILTTASYILGHYGVKLLFPQFLEEMKIKEEVFDIYFIFFSLNSIFALVIYFCFRSQKSENLPEYFPTLVVTISSIFALGLFHLIGSFSSVVIVSLPAAVALAVPFFGTTANRYIIFLHFAFFLMIGLEFFGILTYAPLGVNLKNEDILNLSNVIAGSVWLVATSVIVYVFSASVYGRLDLVQKELSKQYSLLEIEKNKNEALLQNILPQKIIEDLKSSGSTEPETFKGVSVFFSDIVGFTNISSKLNPEFLISELSDIFSNFDRIMEDNNCERIKTIGDAYLGVSNLDHHDPQLGAKSLLKASFEILEYLKERNNPEGLDWKIRIGIHTGDIVGGIVGKKKYIYDVFGDTINTASRMESNSDVMKINISKETYELVKDRYDCKPRGEFQIKGKGNMFLYFAGPEIL